MTDTDRQFCQSNPSACSFCGQNECNRNEINVADPGRQCYTCQGTDCLHSSLTIETCHETDDRCFTIFDGCKYLFEGSIESEPKGRRLKTRDKTAEIGRSDLSAIFNFRLISEHICRNGEFWYFRNIGGKLKWCLGQNSSLNKGKFPDQQTIFGRLFF